MFPQSELDNYKLQVELLQEKLQRSEISRQQLEHKLDKILQKRDEHDKSVRSKARQKYQQFLEEQQRRNERNKQLVQMLERIEQQTEAMNARSERLKMMKLQYEMYFAKLVHSQTRRCIQNSVTPMMAATTSGQAMMMSAAIPPPAASAVMESYHFTTNKDSAAPLVNNLYQNYATTTIPNSEKEQFLRQQPDNIKPTAMEMPTLANFVTSNRNNYMDFSNLNTVPSIPTQQQQLYQQYPVKYEQQSSSVNNPQLPTANNNYNEIDKSELSFATPLVNSTSTLFSVTNLLPNNDKQLADFKQPSNLSTTTTSSTFEEISNVNMRPQITQNLGKISSNGDNIAKINQIANNNDIRHQVNGSFQPLQQPQQSQPLNGTILTATNPLDNNLTKVPVVNNNQLVNNVNSIKQDIRNEIESPAVNEVNNIRDLMDKPATSLVGLETTKSGNELSSPSSNNTNYEPLAQTTIANETSLAATNNEINSSTTTPVSIENIENAIYGELLSPLETEEVPIPENSNVVPKLLENLVTQAENIETNNIAAEETTLKDVGLADNNDPAAANYPQNEENTNGQSYEQTLAYDEYNNAQQPADPANIVADYNNYENVDNAANDDSQQQQLQQEQYDYSNYDPTQYPTYPGYIYDEATGEYKPDPNATAEQYATDQQYNAEGYDQQYQQQEVYDYNQAYAKEPTTPTAENAAYNNYDETSLQELSSNNIPAEGNAEQQQQQPLTEPEATTSAQPNITTEEVPPQPSSNKVAKPTSILSSADKNDKKTKKRVNFVDSSETDESAAVAEKGAASAVKTVNVSGASSESDFDFSSSTDAEPKAT